LQLKKYPQLKNRVILRNFESPIAYKSATDELYELDRESFNLLIDCDGSRSIKSLVEKHGETCQEILDYARKEELIDFLDGKVEDEFSKFKFVPKSPIPSLRYMLLHVTYRCNLRCKHCYLEKKDVCMEFGIFKLLIDEFEKLGGIKIMISGGEPLLHPEIWRMIQELMHYEFRKVLISNGTIIDERNIGKLEVDEVQLSLDGLPSNDSIRGPGVFEKVKNAIRLLRDAGIDVSIATMVHKLNLGEFKEMEKFLRNYDVKVWMIDYPSIEGDLKSNLDLLADLKEAAKIMAMYGFGDMSHTGKGEYGCGVHLCSSDPAGNISRCGFFDPVGNIKEGLLECWKRLNEKYLWRIDDIETCNLCELKYECRGGCRFRAFTFGNLYGPDPVMCEISKLSG
jgi:radical SAM protein with 4Fe4S-binding SPASM domain